ncbi:MAG: hypothetical protein Q8Q15_02985 [bacterium]|nr:hypothetical protein [bacterium]
MNKTYSFDGIKKLLEPVKNALVVIPSSPNFDQVASGLALYLTILKSGKQATILSPDPMTVEFSHLVGVDKIEDKMPSGELVLTINAPIDNIEKVSSTDENGKLNLTIRPKPGMVSIKPEDIVFSQVGQVPEVIFVIEARRLESLGVIYQGNENLFKEKPIINISHYLKAEQFGAVNVIDPSSPCASEIIVGLIENLGLTPDEDIATNLLLGLRNGTANFQGSGVNPETFEAAALCLRWGAGKPPVPIRQGTEGTPPPVETPSPDWFEPKIYKGSTLP